MTRLKQRLFPYVHTILFFFGSLAGLSQILTNFIVAFCFACSYQGHISAALVLGGVDSTGAHLYTVYPHGSVDRLPYATMGSGSLAAMAVFEAYYKDNLEVCVCCDAYASFSIVFC